MALALNSRAAFLEAQGFYTEARPFLERSLGTILVHLSKNMNSMTEAERFQYLDIQAGPEPLLLNLIAIGSGGEAND